MPFTGDAKTAYQREYMRRRRAEQAAANTDATDEGCPSSDFAWSPEHESVWLMLMTEQIVGSRMGWPPPEEVKEGAFRDAKLRIISALMGFREWLLMASDNAIADMTMETLLDRERWEKEIAEEEASAKEA